VARKTLMAVIPFYSDVSRLNGCDLATVCLIAVEANASADFEESGLVGSHFFVRLIPVGT
jgi:hypothetical protein